ncbi:MAG: hypothetical protein A2Z08_09945 [Deltaproteobacteria bacterium RBG_16_54_11]|nr:MAG: hypothetical protein A2Z08_09945 [Deltaproteobacteria bacterium RBG_16_54_11]
MKKVLLTMLGLFVLVFALSGISYGWQGRMGGMGDPFGLVVDESDYLIHPAKIANGEGVRFYGDYRFTYTGVIKWDDRFSVFGLSGVLINSGLIDVSGQELGHDALVGAAFPLWLGRMGLFFTYDGMRGDYDGMSGTRTSLAMENNLDNFAVRVLYGLPVGGGFKLGAETQLAYRHELQEMNVFSASQVVLNSLGVPYPFPNNSSYLEALFKGSMEGKIGSLDVEFTLRGGFYLPGSNSSEWDFQVQSPPGNPVAAWKPNGEVHGWQVGSDLWLRYPLAPDLTLPFLVRADYLQRTRNGFGSGFDGPFSTNTDFRGEVRDLTITVGGGVDKEFGKATRIAAGIYYNYLQRKEDFTYTVSSVGPGLFLMEDLTYPDSMEHQLLLRLAGEHTLSPAVTLRVGLKLFYGWVIPEAKFASAASIAPLLSIFDVSSEGPGHGYDWGIGVSLGGTVKVKPLTLEPFIGGGYRQLHLGLHGVGFSTFSPMLPPIPDFPDDVITRNEWSIGGGLSILYDL